MQFILRRIFLIVTTLIAVSFVTFMLLSMGPNPADELRSDPRYTPQDIQRLSEHYGWNRPLVGQYQTWIVNFVRGDWGYSRYDHRPIRQTISERMPLTLMLTLCAQLLSLLISVPLSLWIASRRNSKTDHSSTVAAAAVMAMPGFLLAMMLQLISILFFRISGHMPIFASGAPIDGGGILETFQRMLLPITTLAILQIAVWVRFQRSELLEVLASDYVTSATARGIPQWRVHLIHALPNLLLPVLTIAALDAAMLIGGSVIVESIYSLPGMGSLLLDAVLGHDTALALDIVTIGALLMVVTTSIADILYERLDPRTKDKT